MTAPLPSRPPGSGDPGVPFLHRPEPGAAKQVSKVIEEIARVMARVGPVELDMEAHRMEVLHPEHRAVGSIGGWYALGSKDLGTQWVTDPGDERRSVLVFEGADARARGGWVDAVAWSFEGEQAMARSLGFRVAGELLEWAGRHPEWWGNDWGLRMFHTAQAYGGAGPDAPVTLGAVALHWREVAARIEAMSLDYAGMSVEGAVAAGHAAGLLRSTMIEGAETTRRLDPAKTAFGKWAGRIAGEVVAECEGPRADPGEICSRWRRQLDWVLKLAPGEIARVNEAFEACARRRAEQVDAWKQAAGERRGMSI